MSGPRLFDDIEACVDAVVSRVGKRIVLGIPLGIGKPNRFVNALYRRACADSSLHLQIVTALTPRVPSARGLLEERFLAPLVDRLYKGYESLDYGAAVRDGSVPSNIQIAEFYFAPGAYLDTPYPQREHVSANYSHVAQTLVDRGVNVIAQAIAKREQAGEVRYSVGSNPDLIFDLVRAIGAERRPLLVGQVAPAMPFMANDAETKPEFWDLIVDQSDHRAASPLFAAPNKPVGLVDYAIAIHVASMVRDGGTLQIGIGSLADAVAHLVRLRHRDNHAYRHLVERLIGEPELSLRASIPVERERFEQGLYGCSEMLVEGLMHLVDAGVLRRRVTGTGSSNGRVFLHAAFFLGSNALYERLRTLRDDEVEGIAMTGVRFVNTLDDDFAGKTEQRREARFVNSAMMVTLDGAIVSDALEGKRVVSGVGGQHDFIGMAQRLSGARSIIMLPATRIKAGKTESNIVFDYPHTTIPRQFRDIVVTEYGAADLRGASDRDVMTRLLNITDSRFQPELLRRAQAAGKIEPSYRIPAAFCDNLPLKLGGRFDERGRARLPHFPLGSDFTEAEARLAVALGHLKESAGSKRAQLGLILTRAEQTEIFGDELERMELIRASSIAERLNRRLLCAALARTKDDRPLFGG
jgi:acyl-CoA hydrolase